MKNLLNFLFIFFVSLSVEVRGAEVNSELDLLSAEIERSVELASDILVVRVMAAKIINPESRIKEVEAEYILLESLKGSKNIEGRIRSDLQNTGLFFTVGLTYLIFLYDTPYVNCCEGSMILWNYNRLIVGEEKELLDKIRLAINIGSPL